MAVIWNVSEKERCSNKTVNVFVCTMYQPCGLTGTMSLVVELGPSLMCRLVSWKQQH